MARVIHTPRSDADLLMIWNSIVEHNFSAADKLIRKIDETIQLLAHHPHAGARQDKYHPGLRSYVIGNYVIYYVPIENGVELRVLHAARQHEDLL